MICITHYNFLGSQICASEIGGAHGTHVEYRVIHRMFQQKTREDQLKDLETVADVILKCIQKKLDGVVWSGLF